MKIPENYLEKIYSGILGKLIGVLLAPAQKIALVIKEPSGQLARLLNKRSQDLEKTN